MHLIAQFFAGAFLCNAVPHLCAGLQGQPFPSPFARPSGIGDSSPTVNVLWGFFNLLVGLVLLAFSPVAVGPYAGFGALFLGALLMGILTSRHFGKVQAAKSRK